MGIIREETCHLDCYPGLAAGVELARDAILEVSCNIYTADHLVDNVFVRGILLLLSFGRRSGGFPLIDFNGIGKESALVGRSELVQQWERLLGGVTPYKLVKFSKGRYSELVSWHTWSKNVIRTKVSAIQFIPGNVASSKSLGELSTNTGIEHIV